MAIIEQPPRQLELAPAGRGHARETLGVFRRPTATTGWKSWLFTVDHKKIGIMYGAAAMVFFVVGGIEALLIRLQLAQPNGTHPVGPAPTTRCSRCTAPRWSSCS